MCLQTSLLQTLVIICCKNIKADSHHFTVCFRRGKPSATRGRQSVRLDEVTVSFHVVFYSQDDLQSQIKI